MTLQRLSIESATESVMRGYKLVIDQHGGPTLLRPRKVESREPVYLPAVETGGWRKINSDDLGFYKHFFFVWKEALDDLKEIRTQTCGPQAGEYEGASERAYFASLGLLAEIFWNSPDLPPPDVVPSGNGGVDIEWSSDGGSSMTIHIRKGNDEGDRIYSQSAGKYGSIPLNERNLPEAVRSFKESV